MNAASSTRSKLSLSLAVVLLTACFSSSVQAQDQPAPASASQNGPVGAPATTPAAAPDNHLHADLLFYLWLAGAHGTIEEGGQTVDFKATPSELLKHFRFGLMGTVQLQRGRFVFIN